MIGFGLRVNCRIFAEAEARTPSDRFRDLHNSSDLTQPHASNNC